MEAVVPTHAMIWHEKELWPILCEIPVDLLKDSQVFKYYISYSVHCLDENIQIQ